MTAPDVPSRPARPRRRTWPLALLGLGLWAGFLAFAVHDTALSDAASGRVAAVFSPWTPADARLTAVAASEARIIDVGGGGLVWVVDGAAPGLVGRLRAAGAMAAFPPPGGISCAILGLDAFVARGAPPSG